MQVKGNLTLKLLQLRCDQRLKEITEEHGTDHGENWSLNDWAVALSGEVGELANLLKKIRRGDFTTEDAHQALKMEWADIQAYLIYIANALGIDAEEAFLFKWNMIGDRLDLPSNMDSVGNIAGRHAP